MKLKWCQIGPDFGTKDNLAKVMPLNAETSKSDQWRFSSDTLTQDQTKLYILRGFITHSHALILESAKWPFHPLIPVLVAFSHLLRIFKTTKGSFCPPPYFSFIIWPLCCVVLSKEKRRLILLHQNNSPLSTNLSALDSGGQLSNSVDDELSFQSHSSSMDTS